MRQVAIYTTAGWYTGEKSIWTYPCPKCGYSCNSDWNFCPICGNRLRRWNNH